jgi:hypothetical protein
MSAVVAPFIKPSASQVRDEWVVIEIARISDQLCCSLSEQIANGQISKSAAKDHLEYFKEVWGPEKLKRIGERFVQFRIKPRRETRRVGGKRAGHNPCGSVFGAV